jgi:hypothetical protein
MHKHVSLRADREIEAGPPGWGLTSMLVGNRRELRNVILVISGIVSVVPVAMTFVWLMGGFEDAKQNKSH